MAKPDLKPSRTELNRNRRTVPQLLEAAAKDTDAASVFYNGTGPADYDSAILVIKGRENVDYVVAMLTRQQLVTPGKSVEPDCTEPNRAACPRLCGDFCNKAEEGRQHE